MKTKIAFLGGLVLIVWAAFTLIFPAQSPEAVSGSQGADIDPTSPDGAMAYRSGLAIAAAKTDEQNPLRKYKPTRGMEGRKMLDEIFSNGVPATAQSVVLAQSLLRSSSTSPDEKIPLIRILASLHNRENTTGANRDIALDLKALTADADKRVAAQAAIKYARLDYQPGTEFVLKAALENGSLDADTYFQELAHLIPSSPLEKRKEFLFEIRRSGSSIARDVLVMALNSGEEFNAASFLKSSEDMAQLLRDTEPKFSPAVGLGLGEAVRYTEWLRASAAVEGHRSGRSVDDVIISTLSAPGTDPRKVLGYLVSPHAAPLLAAAVPDSPVQRLVSVAERYANQSPGDQGMNAMAQEIRARMKNPPAAMPHPAFGPPAGPLMPPGVVPPGIATRPTQ